MPEHVSVIAETACMANHYFTVEDLMLDESFVSYCLRHTTANIEKWETIIHAHPDSEPIFTEAEQLVNLLHSGLTKKEIDTELQHIQSQIQLRQIPSANEEETAADVLTLTKKKTRYKWLYAGVAASLLVGVFLFFGSDNKQVLQSSQPSFHTVFNQGGNRKKVMLPDGTEVYLNGSSSVSWNKAFNQTDRQLTLTGSAFFKVAKNAAKPFTVHSGALSTTALGTQFYVQQLPMEKDIQVSLLEGKIDVEQQSDNHQNIVYPGEEMIYSSQSHHLQKQQFDTDALQRWLRGELSFSHTKLKDIIHEISFWYNVNIQLQNTKLSDKLVTGAYQDASLDDVLKVMSFSLGFTYTTNGNTVIIH